MKRAIVSDIHSNLEALHAVLADIERQGISEIYCLGDIVGYGPNPCECVDLAIQFELSILGNHDQGACFDPEGFSSGAERAIFWTRQQLESAPDAEQSQRRWSFLCELPRTRREDDFLYVHGSARSPLNEYVFPEDTYNLRKIQKIFTLIDHVCFQGHTHVPGVFTHDGKFFSPSDLNNHWQIGPGKVMVNVGSVGQPRDNDPRSCYVILDDDALYFRRVEYPVEQTSRKIFAIPELDNFLGERLHRGR